MHEPDDLPSPPRTAAAVTATATADALAEDALADDALADDALADDATYAAEAEADGDDTTPMTAAEAEHFLAGVPLIPALSGSIPEMKALRARCLAAGIPALLGCPPGAGKG